MAFPPVTFCLPEWADSFLISQPKSYPTSESRMQFVVELARKNIEYQTGGPFGAAVFEISTHSLIAPGVNMVVPMQCSVAHAEVIAIMIAQKILGRYNLGGHPSSSYELVCSTEPCSMCLGAIHWTNVSRLVCGAREEDARAIGFDEGVKPTHWISQLEQRGTEVLRDVDRKDAVTVLEQYREQGGVIYNA